MAGKGKWYNWSKGLVWTPKGQLSFPSLDEARAAKDYPDRKYWRANVSVDRAIGLQWLEQEIMPEFDAAMAAIYPGTKVDSTLPVYGSLRNGQPIKLPPKLSIYGWSDGDIAKDVEKGPIAPGKIILNASLLSTNPRPKLRIAHQGDMLEFNGSPAEILEKFYAGAIVQVALRPCAYNNGGALAVKFDAVAVLFHEDGPRFGGPPPVSDDALARSAGLSVGSGSLTPPPPTTPPMSDVPPIPGM